MLISEIGKKAQEISQQVYDNASGELVSELATLIKELSSKIGSLERRVNELEHRAN